MTRELVPGKLPSPVLEALFRRLPSGDPRVRVGPGIGEDAAVIDMGGSYLVAKTDPITFATDRIGWYVVHVNANDVACMGAEPKWFLVTCLLPERGTGEEEVAAIIEDLGSACSELGITVCGGHTEVTLGLSRPILVGQLLGEVAKDRLVDKRRVRPGDVVLLTGGIAVEGSAVIARERKDFLQGRVPAEVLERAAGFLEDPGISVVRASRIALEAGGRAVHGFHDPTEGGLRQGVRELAERAGVEIRVEPGRVPVFPETRAVCEPFGIDPMGLLASGALLVVVEAGREGPVRDAVEGAGIPCARIGEVGPRGAARVRWGDARNETGQEGWVTDELVKAFADLSPKE